MSSVAATCNATFDANRVTLTLCRQEAKTKPRVVRMKPVPDCNDVVSHANYLRTMTLTTVIVMELLDPMQWTEDADPRLVQLLLQPKKNRSRPEAILDGSPKSLILDAPVASAIVDPVASF